MEWTSTQTKRVWQVVIFGIFYLFAFFCVENRKGKINIIHSEIDDYIPFCEYFIVPYILWFVFVAVVVLYFTLINKSDAEFYRLAGSLAIAMVVFLIISFVYPNGQHLRPYVSGDNIFEKMVRMLYRIDTSTNILPSLHVFNAVACCIAVWKNKTFRKHKVLISGVVVLTVLIVLSTMFLKQHSIIDVAMALVLNSCCYHLFYYKDCVGVMQAYKKRNVWKKSEHRRQIRF